MTRNLAVCLLSIVLVIAPVRAAKQFSDWYPPTNIGAAINSPDDELLPHVSKDGLSLYFVSDRAGGFGDYDIWVARRARGDHPWSLPINVGGNINSSFNDRAPALSRDGHYLFFASNRPGGLGLQDIWVAYRSNVHDDFDWDPPTNLGAGINGPANDYGPSFLENDDIGIPILFFGSTRPGGSGGFDIYVSHLLANGFFGDAHLITELSSPHADFRAAVRPDGLELFFDSNRPGPPGTAGGLRDLWASTRDTVSDPWSAPTSVGAGVNSAFDDVFPALASDGRTLVFTSDRPGGFGNYDLFESVRDKAP